VINQETFLNRGLKKKGSNEKEVIYYDIDNSRYLLGAGFAVSEVLET